jgi:hypothetical protein
MAVDELPSYRPVSALAVIACIGGVCSAAALVAPILWMVPLIGVALSVAALADVARPPAGKAGRLVALAGLALSLGFGAQAATTAAASQWVTARRAEAAARYWFEAVCAGRLADARSMAMGEGDGDADRAADAVDTALGECGADRVDVRCLGPGDVPESWRVRATGRDADLELILARRVRRGMERWHVAACEPLTPSSN